MAKMEPRVADATGSSKGIGSAVATQSSAHGASVVVKCSGCRIIREPGTRDHPLKLAEDPDADFIASAQNGDLEAFEELVRRHSRFIYRALVAILGDRDGAQDAMQDAFLSAFKHIAGFQGRSKFSTWLVSIARNVALQRLRHRKDVPPKVLFVDPRGVALLRELAGRQVEYVNCSAFLSQQLKEATI
jgi:NAD(P)-dependent dehydrogenase (short-subunit alcohol dehydrogenase family)